MLPSAKTDILQEAVPKTQLEEREVMKEQYIQKTHLNMGAQEHKPETKGSFSANVLPNVWNLISNIFSPTSDKKQEASYGTDELRAVKDNLLNLIHMDSIFRVCQTQPHSVQSTLPICTFWKHSTIHVFPWNRKSAALEANIKVSYGKISKLFSPRQQHQESKQNLTSKKEQQMINKVQNQNQSGSSRSQESNEISVVQIVWNGFEDLKNAIMCKNTTEQLHIGRVWVSPF